MINPNSKKLSCFPVILFYQNTLPFHFYDTILFLPSSTSLPPSSIAYPKSCWTHCEAIYIPPSLQMIPSHIQSVLILLGNFLSGGKYQAQKFLGLCSEGINSIPGKRYKGIPRSGGGPLCIQQGHKGPGISSEKVKLRLWRRGI